MSNDDASTRPKRGRPPSKLPEAVRAKVGPPPDDPLELAAWASKALAQVIALQMAGEIPPAYATSLRSSLKSLASMVPAHTVQAVRRKLRDRDAAIASDTAGPPIEAVPPDAPKPVRH